MAETRDSSPNLDWHAPIVDIDIEGLGDLQYHYHNHHRFCPKVVVVVVLDVVIRWHDTTR